MTKFFYLFETVLPVHLDCLRDRYRGIIYLEGDLAHSFFPNPVCPFKAIIPIDKIAGTGM